MTSPRIGSGLLLNQAAGHPEAGDASRSPPMAVICSLAFRPTVGAIELLTMAGGSGCEVVPVGQIVSPQRLAGVTQAGKAFSLHASAIEMALFAQLTGGQVAECPGPV